MDDDYLLLLLGRLDSGSFLEMSFIKTLKKSKLKKH